MNLEQAKKSLEAFLGDKVLTFSIRKYPDGEWIAQCNEIPAIMTGGMGDDISKMDMMMRDAIVTAAGIDSEYAGEVLKFVGYGNPARQRGLMNRFRPTIAPTSDRHAEYALT